MLIRALEGPAAAPPSLASGPGKLCRALGITVAHSGVDLVESPEIRLFRESRASVREAVTPRIGIDYAGDAREWPLRFFDPASSAVSGRRK